MLQRLPFAEMKRQRSSQVEWGVDQLSVCANYQMGVGRFRLILGNNAFQSEVDFAY